MRTTSICLLVAVGGGCFSSPVTVNVDVGTGGESSAAESAMASVTSVASSTTSVETSGGASTATSSGSTTTGSASPWQARRDLQLLADKLPVSVDDFPLLIKLTADRIEYELTAPDGHDLRFWLEDGTGLAFEIESWDPQGASFVWVRLPRIGLTADALVMDYGNPMAPDVQDPAAVWAGRYTAVWHMRPDDPASPSFFRDSTASGNDAVPNVSPSLDGGQAVLGPNLTLAPGHLLNVAASGTLVDADEIGVEAWVHPTAVAPSTAFVVQHNAYQLSATDPAFMDRPVFTISGVLDDAIAPFDMAAPTDTWTFLAATYDGPSDRVRLYYNGESPVEQGTSGSGGLNTTALPLTIGSGFGGRLDEVRISTGEAQPPYLLGQYLSMTDQLVEFGEPYDP